MVQLSDRPVAPYEGGRIIFRADAEEKSVLEETVPGFEPIIVQGAEVGSCPVNFETSEALQSLGFRYLDPTLFDKDFEWAGKFPPWEHQRKTVAFLHRHPKCHVLNGMGTGKTKSCIWAVNYLRHHGKLQGPVVILSTKRTMKRVWRKELKELDRYADVVLLNQATDKDLEAARSASWIIINHDAIKGQATKTRSQSLEDFLQSLNPELYIVDEASVFKGYSSTRYKVLFRLLKNSRYWGLTATPTPNGPVDGYALAKLVGNAKAPRTLTAWRAQTETAVMRGYGANTFPEYIPRPGWENIVHDYLTPAIRFNTEDCLDLPEHRFIRVPVELSKQQSDLIKQIKRDRCVEDESGVRIDATNPSVLINKIRQILMGAVIAVQDKKRVVAKLDARERLDTMAELIAESESKSIVFVPYVAQTQIIKEHLEDLGYRVGVVNGATKDRESEEIFRVFEEGGDLDVMVAHPKCTSHGLNLVQASTIIWYGPHDDVDAFEQANKRIHRQGQRRKCTSYLLGSHDVEWKRYDNLEAKQAGQAEVLSLIEAFFS